MWRSLADMLSGGHPNSLGRTIEVVDMVLADPPLFDALFDTYQSADPVVRLRTSNAMRRVEAVRHDLLVPYIDRFIHKIGDLDQPSAQWTLAVLFDLLSTEMSAEQRAGALTVMQRNMANHTDWIVRNNTMETLTKWAKADSKLRIWLIPHLKRMTRDDRKSVSSRAIRKLQELNAD